MFSEFSVNVGNIQQMVMVEHTALTDDLVPTGLQTKITFAPDQASFEIRPERSQNGIVYNYSIKANIARMQNALNVIAETYYRQYVFFITDYNGNGYIIGQKDLGYRIDISGSVAEINTMQLSLNARSGAKPIISEYFFETQPVAPISDFVVESSIFEFCDPQEEISQNIVVVAKIDGDTITHTLNTTSVAVSFFTNNVQRQDAAALVVDENTIKLLFPDPDGLGFSFTGEIFIQKRNVSAGAEFQVESTVFKSCDGLTILAENKLLENKADGDMITHTLGSTHVAVSFFKNNIQQHEIGYVIIDANNIKLVSPDPDILDYRFTGDIFIQKRNVLL